MTIPSYYIPSLFEAHATAALRAVVADPAFAVQSRKTRALIRKALTYSRAAEAERAAALTLGLERLNDGA